MSSSTELFIPDLIEAAVPIVEQAGQAVMAVYRRGARGNQHVGVQLKSDDSPVTEADLAANQILIDGLQQIAPQIPVVSEETEDTAQARQSVGKFWLLDPVDGTREFLARTDEFTVNVALIVNSVPVLGIVQAPALGQLYWGAIGHGAWRKDSAGLQSIQVSTFPARNPSNQFDSPIRIVASRSHMNEATKAHIATMQPQTMLGVGSSLKFCRIAEGGADYYPRLGPTNEWDTAAAQAVVEAAGGRVLTLTGERLTYGKVNVLNPHFIVTGQP